jgi:hypothetical protein
MSNRKPNDQTCLLQIQTWENKTTGFVPSSKLNFDETSGSIPSPRHGHLAHILQGPLGPEWVILWGAGNEGLHSDSYSLDLSKLYL